MLDRFPFLFGILIASLLSNLFIPFAIYYQKYGFFKKRRKGFIGCNTWGIIMDGVLAGLINIAALNLLLDLNPIVEVEDIKMAFFLGFAAMILAHLYMVWAKWNIWIMPRPWQFNLAGYWHIISMTLQMSFLSYPLLLIWKNSSLLEKEIVRVSFMLIFFFSCLFLLSLKLMKKGVRIGRLHISSNPW